MNLNFAHIHGPGANTFQQCNPAARRAFVVRGHKTVQIRAIFHHHLAVGAKPAGRYDHAFGSDGDGFILFRGQAHARHFPVFDNNIAHRSVQHHVDMPFIDVAHQTAYQITAHCRTIFWTVRTIDAHPAGRGDVIKHNAARCQPFDCLWRVFHKAAQQFRVVPVLPTF
ncbi:hypothetical protein D3C72_1763310 [compost metagenome]